MSIAVFNKVFRFRTDVFARYYQKSDGYGNIVRTGYYPVCANAFAQGKCPKVSNQKAVCGNCPQKLYAPLTDQALLDHFNGLHILGGYLLFPDGTCGSIAGDFDDHDGTRNPLNDVKAYVQACNKAGLAAHVLRSKSGRGYHVYFFFQSPVPAWKARLVAFSLLREAGVIGKDVEFSTFDRLFPNQDSLDQGKTLGNLIAMPVQGIAVQQGHTVFLDPASNYQNPYQDQLDIFQNIQRVTEEYLDRIIVARGLKRAETVVAQKAVSLHTSATAVTSSIPQGQRNNTLTSLAGTMRQRGMEVAAIEAALLIQNQQHCVPPLPDDEVRTIAQGIARYAPGYSTTNLLPATIPSQNQPQLQVIQLLQLQEAKEYIKEIIAIAQKSPKLVVDEIMKEKKYLDALTIVNIQEPQLFELTMGQLSQSGVLVKEVDRIRKLIGRLSKKRNKRQLTNNNNLTPVVSKIPGAPVEKTIIIPQAYGITIDGIEKVTWLDDRDGTLTEKREIVTTTPVLIVGRLIDIENQGESIKIAWFRDNHWRDLIIERKIIATARDITVLSNPGVPVTSLTANLLVEFLAEFESLNLAAIPLSRITAKLGWLKNMQAFLCGPTLITSANYSGEAVTFQGRDDGDDQIAKGFYQVGEYTVWIALANDLFSYHIVIANIYFALIPPFLKIFKADNFTVDIAFITSRGKTTSLRVGGSVWGNPNEKDSFSVVHTWAATFVWIDRALSICNDLPLLLDDTKTAGTGRRNDDAAAKVSQVLYMVEKGRGRERGSIEGTRKTGSWNSLLLSTGEQAITDFTTGEGGSRARALVFWGAPFGKSTQITADLVKRINRTVIEHFGHAGPRVVKFILDHRNEWDLWRNVHRELQIHFSNRAGSNPVAVRLSSHFATLATIIPIVHAALPELRRDYPIKKIIDHLWLMAISGADDADRATAALHFAYNWAAANQSKFWGRHQLDSNQNPKEPVGGWAGVWEEGNYKFIGFTTQTLKKLLTDQGFDFEAVVRTWQDRQWLETEKKGRQKQVRIDNTKTYAYTIKKAVIEKELGIIDN